MNREIKKLKICDIFSVSILRSNEKETPQYFAILDRGFLFFSSNWIHILLNNYSKYYGID